ncbi:MAG: ATP-binding protein [Acidobacteria bacterium]|nr:ATP-binding protein [Acidobacteriota bacterium]MBU4306284.1 ATP-binding protein [Acidobacteriota bacterium]MCG2812351.1 ATP-binding protein [Candidatus Aminicenantes bacterium]
MQKNRLVYQHLPKPNENIIVLLTGSRQTGKTTSAKHFYPKLNYFNLDAWEYRDQLSQVSSFNWGSSVGNAILDEIQKEPALFDKIKFAFDAKKIDFSVLLGSSQILLLKKVRETLAGRVLIYELWPLCLCELISDFPQQITLPLLDHIIAKQSIAAACNKLPEIADLKKVNPIKNWEAYLLQWGGMPGLLPLQDDRKWEWLKSFEATYLERDLADLARISDLKPFKTFQHLAAQRYTGLLSFSEIARDAAISVETVRRYIEYLKMSYQVFLLPPYHTNISSTLIKTPKIYWTDMGILRQLTGIKSQVQGPLFENYIVSEIMKYISSSKNSNKIYFYRTRSGLEIDLLIEMEKGLIGIEIKARDTIHAPDITAMKTLAKNLKNRWLGGMVVYRGDRIYEIDAGIWAVPSYRLLS